jgi:hypothetical protein
LNLDKVEEKIRCRYLDWERPDFDGLDSVDVIVSSDVIYDDRVIPHLMKTVEGLLVKNPNARFIISSTIRNETTYQFFKSLLEKFHVETVYSRNPYEILSLSLYL